MVDLRASASSRALAAGSLNARRPPPVKSGRSRVLGLLYRKLVRDPLAVLALRPRGATSMRWAIAEAPALTARTLAIQRAGEPDVAVSLDDRTIAQVRDALLAAGVVLDFATDDPEILTLSALALVPGTGEQWQSNGDHIYAYRNPLWSWADPVGRWLDQSRTDIGEMLRMLVVRQSGGYWSELWASYFGLARKPGEGDDALNRRTEYEWRRPRSNPKAIEANIRHLLGAEVTVREPWREMMIVSGSVLSGGDHLPNEQEFAYHRAQLVSRDGVDWDAASAEAEADRPAGTLFLPPVTLPDPWEIVVTGISLDGGGDPTFSTRIQDFDGQIISVSWDLSNTYVLVNPSISGLQNSAYSSAPLGDAGDVSNHLTFSKGQIILSEQWPLGDLQGHLAGHMPVESGGGLEISGGTGLSDYEHALVLVPVDEWHMLEQGFDPGEPFDFPPQGTFDKEQGMAGSASLDAVSIDNGAATTTGLSAGSAYGTGWTGRWNSRPWVGAYAFPVVAFGATDPDYAGSGSASSTATGSLSVPKPLVAAATSRATATASLTTAIRLVGSAVAQATATGNPSLPALFVASGAAQASAVGTLATSIRLAGGAAAQAQGAASLTTGIRFAGAGAAQASATATLASSNLNGAAQGTATATAALTTAQAMAASGAAQASATGSLTVGARMVGAGQATAAGSASLRVAARMVGAAMGQSAASGSLATAIRLAGSGAAQATGLASSFGSLDWNPTALGGALVYALDTNDVASVPDDGSGKAQYARHLYAPSKAMVQATPSRRPGIATGGGVNGNMRVLTLGNTGLLVAGGTGGTLPDIVSLMAAPSDLRTPSATLIVAVQTDANAPAYIGSWGDAAAGTYVHLRQNSNRMSFQAANSFVAEANPGYRIGGWNIITAIKDGATLTLRFNGQVVATGTMQAETAFSPTDFALGGYLDIAGYMPGDAPQALSGVIVASGALAGTTLTQAERWVGLTAGIGATATAAALAGAATATASATGDLTAAGAPASVEYDTTNMTFLFEPDKTDFVTTSGGRFTALRNVLTPDDASQAYVAGSFAGPYTATRGGRAIMEFGAPGPYGFDPQTDYVSNMWAWTGGNQTLNVVVVTPATWPAANTDKVQDFMPLVASYLAGNTAYQHAFGFLSVDGVWRMGTRLRDGGSVDHSTWALTDLQPDTRYVFSCRYTSVDGGALVELFINGQPVAMAGDGIAPTPRSADWYGDFETTSVGFAATAYGGSVFLGYMGDIIKCDAVYSDAQIAAMAAVAMARYPT
jgi:hypothetical protein